MRDADPLQSPEPPTSTRDPLAGTRVPLPRCARQGGMGEVVLAEHVGLAAAQAQGIIHPIPGVDALMIRGAHVLHAPVPLPEGTVKRTEPRWPIVEKRLAESPADRCPDGKTLAVALHASSLPSASIGQRVIEERWLSFRRQQELSVAP